MNRTAADFAPGQYLLALSPAQLTELLGTVLATSTTDQYCRVSPLAPNILELWLTDSPCAGGTYVCHLVAKPADWLVYTVSGVYEDNDQAFVQTVLARHQDEAIDTAQRIAFASSQGYEVAYEGDQMLDPDNIEANLGYGEDAHPVTVRNANRYPEHVGYLVAWVMSGIAYRELFLADSGPYADEPVSEGFRRLTASAVAFLNELPDVEADALQDEQAARFESSFFAQYGQ